MRTVLYASARPVGITKLALRIEAPDLPAVSPLTAAETAPCRRPCPLGLGDPAIRQRNLWVLLAHARLVSPPDRLRAAQPRLHQLAMARACGLEVPPTLVTNDPDRARTFVARYQAVVAKAIGVGHVAHGQHDVALYATRLERGEIDTRIAEVASAPVLLQECIAKCADVRARLQTPRNHPDGGAFLSRFGDKSAALAVSETNSQSGWQYLSRTSITPG